MEDVDKLSIYYNLIKLKKGGKNKQKKNTNNIKLIILYSDNESSDDELSDIDNLNIKKHIKNIKKNGKKSK